MQGTIEKSFGVNLSVLSLFNLYHPDRLTISVKVKTLSVFLLAIPPVPVLGVIYFLVENNLTTAEFNENAFLIAEMACQVFKFFPFVTNGTRIKECINFFDLPQFKPQKKKQIETIDTCCATCKRNSTIFLGVIFAGNIFFATKPLLLGAEKKLPALIWLPFDAKSDPIAFICVYVFVVFGVAYTAFACGAVDPLIGGLVCLASGQLQVLKDNLQHLNEYVEEQYQKEETFRRANRRKLVKIMIKQCVIQHKEILRFVSEYEACFSTSIFSQIMGSVLVICFCCLQISKLEPLSFEFISMATFLSIVLIQIYVYCYYGTILFGESNTLRDAVYMGIWYECDLPTKKSLMVLMERSKKPMVIIVGKILKLSVDTFTTILRRSYSLLAVLQSL